MRPSFLILLLPVLLAVHGCISTPEPDIPRRVEYIFNVANVGETIHASQDSIRISEFKLLADKFHLITSDSAVLETRLDALIMAYREQNQDDDELVFSAGIGYEDFEKFKGLELFIDRAPEGIAIRDADFLGTSSNYSLIIKGSMNGESFTYKSGAQFRKAFQFNEVVLTDEKETLVLRVLLDINDILIDEADNTIINPDNSANKTVIDSLVQESLNMQASAAKRF